VGTALKHENKVFYEILSGQPVAIAKPSMNHVFVSGNIHNIFKQYLKGKFCRVASEAKVILSDKDTFAPDVMVICKSDIKSACSAFQSTARLDRF